MPPRVLVADPDRTTREQVAAALARQGFSVATAEDGKHALDLIVQSSPELVVCGERLTQLTGIQLCQQVLALNLHCRLVLLYSLPLGDLQRRELCADVGCDGVLCRPLRLAALEALVAGLGLKTPAAVEPAALAFAVPTPAALGAAPPEAPPIPELASAPAAAIAADTTPSLPVPLPLPLPIPMPAAAGPGALSAGGASPTVEPAAAAADKTRLLPPGVPRYGDLTSIPVPRLIYELFVGVYFGILHLVRQRTERAIYFWAGIPVRVDSDQLSDSLGAVLREAGRITDLEYAKAKQLAMTYGQPLGVTLVKTGTLTEHELLEILAHQTERKLISCFGWRDGTYRLEDDTSFASTTVLNEVAPVRAIWRGVREHYDLNTLLSYFSKLRGRYVVATELFATQAEAVGTELRAAEVLELLSGQITFEAALLSRSERTLEIAQALYAMLVTDMIRPVDRPGEPAPVLAAAPKTARPPGLVDYQALVGVADRIAHEYLRLKDNDHFQALGVGRDASNVMVEQAYQRAVAAVHADADVAGLPADDVRRAHEMVAMLAEARDTLLGPERRQAYLERLRSAPSGGGAAADVGGGAAQTAAQRKREALFVAEQTYQEGMRLLRAGDGPQARQKLLAAVELHPEEAAYRVGVAQALLVGEHPDVADCRRAAFGYLEEALRLDPANILANLEAARMLLADRLYAEARHHVERILRRAPEHQAARVLQQEIAAAEFG